MGKSLGELGMVRDNIQRWIERLRTLTAVGQSGVWEHSLDMPPLHRYRFILIFFPLPSLPCTIFSGISGRGLFAWRTPWTVAV
jgi:hypothetical protein